MTAGAGADASVVPDRVVVFGLGRSGEAAARACLERGANVVAVDDSPLAGKVSELDVEVVVQPSFERLASLARWAQLVVVSPGVPVGHPIFSLSCGEVVSELELGARMTRAPMIAVTGTNGKTTVVTLIARMLCESGKDATAVGNIGVPLVEAADSGASVLVVEASSFQLAHTAQFRPAVAVWLNLAPDHLDWHPDLDHYVSSKERIWARQGEEDLALGNAEDPVVNGALERAPGRHQTFGLAMGDWHEEFGQLVSPQGVSVMAVEEMWRSFPSDRANALAALAGASAMGAELEAARDVLVSFEGLAHRVELVGEVAGILYYDDSKATTPDAVLAALAGFPSAVLLAGGRNKGLDLSPLRSAAERLRAVVTMGEAAPAVEGVLEGSGVPTLRAESMREAVRHASSVSRPGDVVLLSPGCASFDWYSSYSERGEDFRSCVMELASGVGQ